MNVQTLYDLSPLLRVMLVGLALALLPLAWVWRQHRSATPLRRVQALTLLTLFLTFDLVLFGAFTRLTDSGLGCPDWPGCYGHASPLGAGAHIDVAQSTMPSGPVTHGKAWVEMVHRYLATSVGVLILVLAVMNWLERWRKPEKRSLSPLWATLTLVWVCIQGAFGALTVTMKLFPAIVTLHLAGGLVLLALLCWQVVRFEQQVSNIKPEGISSGLRWFMGLSFAALVMQIMLGGWVSTNYAVLACSDFPMCQSSWWPNMNFQQGFEVWRGLGLTRAGEPIEFSALTAIHFVHRGMAFVVFIVLGVLSWRLNRQSHLRAQSRWIAALISLQLITGLSNVVFQWPMFAALLHTGGAAALVLVMTWTLAASRARRQSQTFPDLDQPLSRCPA